MNSNDEFLYPTTSQYRHMLKNARDVNVETIPTTNQQESSYQSKIFAERQAERRNVLLKSQKQKRNSNFDEFRGLLNIVDTLGSKNKKTNTNTGYKSKHNRYDQEFDKFLQLSEWLRIRPDDFEYNWLMKPCPKGKRCLVVITAGKTNVYNKYGYQIHSINNDVKGRTYLTILDCMLVEKSKIFYILDCLAYINQSFTNCESTFRFFWIQSKSDEKDFDIFSRNQYTFLPLNTYDCGDTLAISTCLETYPMWLDNATILDGFLFYHKEASYVHGETPLVLWLYPYMIPEMLKINSIHVEHMISRPKDYIDCEQFIRKFDEKTKDNLQRWRKPNNRVSNNSKMIVENSYIDNAMEMKDDDDDDDNVVNNDNVLHTQMVLENENYYNNQHNNSSLNDDKDDNFYGN